MCYLLTLSAVVTEECLLLGVNLLSQTPAERMFFFYFGANKGQSGGVFICTHDIYLVLGGLLSGVGGVIISLAAIYPFQK